MVAKNWKIICFFLGWLLLQECGQKVNNHYPLNHSGNFILDKNFYFLTMVSTSKLAMEVLQKNEVLNRYLTMQQQEIKLHMIDTSQGGDSLLNSFKWRNDSTQLLQELEKVYDGSKTIFDELIDKELKPSNCYYRFNNQIDKDFFLNCWRETFKGINTIIDHYGLGSGFRYRDIDSASYDVNGEYYQGYLKTYFSFLNEHTQEFKSFYGQSLTIALELMKANDRNEPADYEPLEEGENKEAVEQIGNTRFDDYRYSAILVPGQGPDVTTVALDPIGRLRCELAATGYKQKLAPFIIVSGGNVHPFHTPFTEAIEMKKYLMKVDSIPESAIIIEPQARHTTTNFRNAERLMIRYGMPINKASICVSTKWQIDYIMNEKFDQRNIRELGYIPYKNKRRLSDHEIEFYIAMDCMQIDPIDPIDP